VDCRRQYIDFIHTAHNIQKNAPERASNGPEMASNA